MSNVKRSKRVSFGKKYDAEYEFSGTKPNFSLYVCELIRKDMLQEPDGQQAREYRELLAKADQILRKLDRLSAGKSTLVSDEKLTDEMVFEVMLSGKAKAMLADD